jgi:hypothetical protein
MNKNMDEITSAATPANGNGAPAAAAKNNLPEDGEAARRLPQQLCLLAPIFFDCE